MSDRYPHLVRMVSEGAWAIRPEKLAVILEVVALRASGEKFTDEEIQERIGAGPAHKRTETTGNVAVIPIYGTIMPKANLYSQMSGGTSMQQFMASLNEAATDTSIGGVLLDVDSPGGMVDLVPEAAAAIRKLRSRKPVTAVANTDAASAAYWLAAQADEVVVTPSGNMGSIGVFAAHNDISAAQEREGVKTTLVSAGKFKTEGHPFEPLGEEAREAIQKRVNASYDLFVADVAKGRRVTDRKVRNGFGEGRMLTAQDAVAEGLADRVATLEDAAESLFVRAASKRRPVAAEDDQPSTFADLFDAAFEAVDRLIVSAESLADVRERSRLTVAKREPFLALHGRMSELLAATDPARRPISAGQREFLEYVRSTLQ